MKPLRNVTGVGASLRQIICLGVTCGLLAACQPTVRVETPEPIKIYIKIEAEVRIKLEEYAKEDIEANPEIF